MVFHDEDLGRLTAQDGPIANRSSEDLARMPVLGSAETIPTLDAILALVAGRAPLLIEVKDPDGLMAPVTGRLEAAVARALAGYGGPVAVMSFNPHAVAELARLAPKVPRGLTTAAFEGTSWDPLPQTRRAELRAIPDIDRCGASFISHDRTDLSRPRVTEVKAAGVAVLCWTVRSADQERAARTVAQNITFEGYDAPLPG
jgi:glycerophosphoryl diester phosphodiesterase